MKMNGGTVSPEAQRAQWIAMYTWSEPPLTSLTCVLPHLTSRLSAPAAVHKPVSSQLPRCCAVAGSLKSRLTLLANSSTKSNQPLIISGWEAFALFLLKCWGLRSLKQGQRLKKHFHQSRPGILAHTSTAFLTSSLLYHNFPAFLFWTLCTCTTPLIC